MYHPRNYPTRFRYFMTIFSAVFSGRIRKVIIKVEILTCPREIYIFFFHITNKKLTFYHLNSLKVVFSKVGHKGKYL